MRQHRHGSPTILIVMSGTIAEAGEPMPAGTIVCRSAPFEHALQSLAGRSAFACVAMDGALAGYVRDIHSGPTPETSRIALRIASDLRLPAAARELSIRSAVLRLIAWSFSGRAARCLLAESAQLYIDQHFAESITLADVARAVCADPSRMAREYRRTFGTTVGEAIRLRRLMHAGQLLSTTDISLAEIARASGFFDASHLARAWCGAYGVPVSLFRSFA